MCRLLLTCPWRAFLFVAFVTSVVCIATTAWVQSASADTTDTKASDAASEAEAPAAEEQSKTTESVQAEVDKSVEDETADKRKKLVEEAVSTVELTRDALKSLDENKPDEALETLAKITGKLELLVARNPDLGLLPMGVSTKIHDIFAEIDTIEAVIEEAQSALDDGDVQIARRHLENLASEVVISTTQLPLATYPAAIKEVAPLIDAGKIDEAKQQLQTALNLLVVTDAIYPLPDLRAQKMIEEAQDLSENAKRTDEENERLEELLKEVRSQVEFGRKLGYFSKDKAESLLDEIADIQEKTGDGESGKGFFDKLKGLFDW